MDTKCITNQNYLTVKIRPPLRIMGRGRSTFYLQYSQSKVEDTGSELCCRRPFVPTLLMSCTQSPSVSTCMDTIWDLNMNSRRSMSPSVPSVPWRHWQTHKGMNEIVCKLTISPCFSTAAFQRKADFSVINCCLCGEKSHSGTNVNFKGFIREETRSVLVMPRSFKFLYVASSHSSAVKTGFSYFHMAISSGCRFAFLRPPSSSDLRPQFHVASGSCPEQNLTCDKLWTNGFSGVGNKTKLQPAAQEAGASAVLSTLFHKRWLFRCFLGHWKEGRHR